MSPAKKNGQEVLLKVFLPATSVLLCLVVCELLVESFVPLRNVGRSFSTFDKDYGKRLKRSFSTVRRTPEFEMAFSTNRFGHRGPEPIGTPKDTLLFVGDSFTMGYGVNDDEAFPFLVGARLERALGRKLPVVNAGQGGSGNGRWVKFLEGEAARYAPKLVVLQATVNDFDDNRREKLFALSSAGALVALPAPKIGTKRQFQQMVEALPLVADSSLFALLRQAMTPIPHPIVTPVRSTDTRKPRWTNPLTFALIRRSLELCRAKGWPVVGVGVGFGGYFEKALVALFAEFDAPFVLMPLKSERPELYYKVDGHWNANGQRFIGEAISATILETPSLRGALTR